MDKKIRIIEQGSEDARIVSKAMASSTASELLDVLSEHPKTASELETETGYPLPTIQYHLGNLLNAGLVLVSNVRYSEKGKPMKLYTVSDTIIVISPKKKSEEEIRPVLRKYGFTAAGFMIAVSAVAAICNTILKGGEVPQMPSTTKLSVLKETGETAGGLQPSDISYQVESNMAASTGTLDATDALLSQINFGMLIFLIVSLLILAGLMIFEFIRIKKNTDS